MKSEDTIKRWIKELQDLTESKDSDTTVSRIAWSEWHLLRRVVEDVKGWESVTEDVHKTAGLIRRELVAASESAKR